jgi:hypothetical protein
VLLSPPRTYEDKNTKFSRAAAVKGEKMRKAEKEFIGRSKNEIQFILFG